MIDYSWWILLGILLGIDIAIYVFWYVIVKLFPLKKEQKTEKKK